MAAKTATIKREVENPDWTPARDGEKAFPRTVKVCVSTEGCSFLAMYARNQISLPQFAAAERFHQIYFLSGTTGAQAIEYKTPVDGGKVTDGLPAARVDALGELSKIRHELGRIDYAIMSAFAGEGQTVGFIAEQCMGRLPAQREREFYGMRVRDALDLLAKRWGYLDRRA